MRKKIVLVGASTGGPTQIKELLSSIVSLSSTIVIAQHMREEVLPFFASDLKESLKVKLTQTPLSNPFDIPSIIVCSHSSVLEKNSIDYEIVTDTKNQYYTPDINKLFYSFVDIVDNFEIDVVIMTGIGRDGVDGAIALKSCGATVIAQDEKSSPVYGMPKAIVESGVVDDIKSFEQLKEYFRGL